jgi:hypothetical protein
MLGERRVLFQHTCYNAIIVLNTGAACVYYATM